MDQYRIAVVAGSLRRGSYNRQLANAMKKPGPREFTFQDARIDHLRLCNQDDDGNQAAGAAGASMAQQHLRNVLAYLDAPTLGQPEAFIRVADGFFDSDGGIASADTKQLLQAWMDRFAAWVKSFAAR